jgi:transposase InsO family protein
VVHEPLARAPPGDRHLERLNDELCAHVGLHRPAYDHNRRSWPNRREARSAIFEWIEAWYNARRLHSTLGYLSPMNYEQLILEKEERKEEAA